MSMTELERSIVDNEDVADVYMADAECCRDPEKKAMYIKAAEEHRQLAAWLKILKSAKFEYDEAFRIITSPTPDVTDNDIMRAAIVLDVFRDSLGRLE